MTYDALGKLTSRTEYDIINSTIIKSTETYTYDAAGNITVDGSNIYRYNSNNALTRINTRTRNGVDVRGNISNCPVNGSNCSTRFDDRNRLIHIDGDRYGFWYDAENNRIDMYTD